MQAIDFLFVQQAVLAETGIAPGEVPNPDNFAGHRRAMIRLSLIVPALAAAWLLTKQKKYVDHAAAHLRAWFIDETTRMNPNLQAIKGRFTGRGTGIIDTLHLVEVARAAWRLPLNAAARQGVNQWFAAYLQWMTTHPYGIAERDARNNHGTCWVAQVASFAQLTGNAELTVFCRERFRTVLIPNQEAPNGSFPEELRRTKPYGYSLFNLDALSFIAQTLTTASDSLWWWELPDGRGMGRAMSYMYPYMLDKKKWPLPPDVMYDKEWPVRHRRKRPTLIRQPRFSVHKAFAFNSQHHNPVLFWTAVGPFGSRCRCRPPAWRRRERTG